jgi:cobalt-zinc-cadmium efflux system membrane fusion protein
MRSWSRAAAVAGVLMLLMACSEREENASRSTKVSAAAPANERTEDADEDDDAEAQSSGPIRMDEAALSAAGIRIEVLTPSALSEELRAPGEVIDNAYGTTLITPRVDAIVVRRHAKLGDEVAAGAPLVTLSSVEVAQAQGALRLAEQDWERVRALGPEAVSGRRYSEAQVTVEQARAAARAYGVAGSKGNSSGEFTLAAAHAGRITDEDLVVGERIEAGHMLFRLVDESVVWVDAKLPSESAQRVTIGRPAQVVLGGQRLEGKVVQRGHRTAEDTRTALVRIEVPNEGDVLHSGDYVEIYVDAQDTPVASAARLAVPTSALVQFEGDAVVFRVSPEGLVPVPVRTGEVIAERTVIHEGLAVGDRIVVEGAYALKAQLLKSQIGEDDD